MFAFINKYICLPFQRPQDTLNFISFHPWNTISIFILLFWGKEYQIKWERDANISKFYSLTHSFYARVCDWSGVVLGVEYKAIKKIIKIPDLLGLSSYQDGMKYYAEEISPGIPLEELMLKLKLQYFGHLMQRVDSLEKTLIVQGIGGRRRRGRQRMRWLDGITD